MNSPQEPHVETLIEAHFARRTTTEQEATFRSHMKHCGGCRTHYERCLAIEGLIPTSGDAKERMRAALGLSAPPRRRWQGAWATGGVFVATATALCLWLVPQNSSVSTIDSPPLANNEFSERGSQAADVGALSVFELVEGDKLQPLAPAAKISTAAELSLSYRVPATASFAMVFAVDAAKQIHWYVPAWNSPHSVPKAKPVQGGQTYDLGEGVSHPFAAGDLQIVGLFLNNAADVKQVEAAWSSGDTGFLGIDSNASVVTHTLAARTMDEK